MKIKSLLLGSAAAMIAVSGAQAADAIIVEPEPMEYVKVCDMYGAGFFYIPGTETCMNINGYVRSTYTHSERTIKIRNGAGAAAATAPLAGVATYIAGDYNTSAWDYRGRLNFDVRNETEYGTLRSELRLQGGDSSAAGDANVGIDRALIHLAGFRLGYSDTYWTTNHGYGAGSPAINDGFYNYDQALFFDYTATLMDGVSVTVGVQDSNGTAVPNSAASPDIYAGFNASFGGLTVAGTAIRDDIGGGDDEWAYKVSAIMALGDSGWTVGGWYMKDDGGTQYVDGRFSAVINNIHDEAWGIQANGAVASNLSVYGLYTETSGSTNATSLFGTGTGVDVDTNQYAVGLVWAPVSGLTVQAEYFSYETEIDNRGDLGRVNIDDDGVSVRVTRSF